MNSLLRTSKCRRGPQLPYLVQKGTITTNSGTNPYPYPSHANPTPHQIFHLPPTASQKEVKARYYELVRIYHPDSPVARVYPPEISDARFHAISASYDVLRLRGRRATLDPDSPNVTSRPRVDFHALWRAKRPHHRDPIGPADDSWKDGIILGSLVMAIGVLVYQIAASRRRAVKRSEPEGDALLSASEQSCDVHLLTAPDSCPQKNRPSSIC
ncbi:hypothetical protein B0F90DRAFT_1923992 [Multifurca ochricompacta]|uniref:J domain-containing protein n=1 Tax=Multifurca ochricompacta TaxID=376703 RepID=A0AAD4MAN5_9AGAM|nr:hypothetical protein B0F90DRAFT_1923992 [Multifurca ochricompacta]